MNIREIAKLLDVSPGTVSKALNDRADVSITLKEKIRKMACEIGYSPNPVARRLSSRRSETIGVFILSRSFLRMKENFAFEFLDGIADEAASNGYDILFFTAESHPSHPWQREHGFESSYIKMCRDRKVDGAVFIGLTENDPHIQEIRNADFPVALIDLNLGFPHLGSFSTDNAKAMNMGLDYILSQGHTEIGVLRSGPNAQVGTIRYESFRNYLKARKLFRSDFVFPGDFTKESGYRQGKIIAAMKERPTCIFCLNDLMALGLMKALAEEGIHTGRDISIMGFDNILAADYIEPGLTTISQNAIEIGKAAVTYLLARIRGESPSPVGLLEPELIIRRSVTARR